MLRNNSLFKAWRKKRLKEKVKRRMRLGSETTPLESWFVFFDETGPGQSFEWGLGYVMDYDPDTEELLIYDVDKEQEKIVALDDFFRHSEFLEDADADNFELFMNQFYGNSTDDLDVVPKTETTPPDLEDLERGKEVAKMLLGREPWYRGSGIGREAESDDLVVLVRVAPGFREPTIERLAEVEDFPADYEVLEVEIPRPRIELVAKTWLEKTAFNKENPTDLLSQLVKVLERAVDQAEGRGQERLTDVMGRLQSLNRDVQEAWRRRREE